VPTREAEEDDWKDEEEEIMRCKALMIFGDDHGDNECTFRCELEEGHEGPHRESGSMYSKFPYTLQWNEDMREKCEVCGAYEKPGKRFEHCTVCFKDICPDCIATTRTYLPDPDGGLLYYYCEECKDKAGGKELFVCLIECGWVGRFEEAEQKPVEGLPDPEDRGLFCPRCGSGVTPAKPLEK
jgi:hypothetical protein